MTSTTTASSCFPLTDAELRRFASTDEQSFGGLVAPRGRLPLTAMSVEAQIIGLVAEVRLIQTFENTCGEAIEATYIFPLPDRAAVTRFQMEVAGRLIEGIIDERGKARLEYEEAIAAGHRAALAEEDRAGVFTLQVGNLAPGDVARVTLTLVGPVPIDSGEATFQFPLVVAPRYIPGRELPGPSAGSGVADDTDAVPDASRISPPVLLRGCKNPVRLSIGVSIDPGGLSLGAPRSSLHAVSQTTREGGHRVQLEPGERLDRDFILRWRVGGETMESSALLTPDRSGKGATLSVTLAPPLTETRQRARDVVFLLDRSGSMNGWKMVAARRAVARMVDTLTSADRFAVTAFNDRSESPPQLSKGLETASDRARFRAVEFLANIEAQGGTELRQPLLRAAELLGDGDSDRDRVLVLVTDGQVGNEDQILEELSARIRTTRVFSLGIDRAVNAAFLRRLAALGGGSCELVESEERLDEVMAKVHRRIGTPLLTELALSSDGIEFESESVAPQRLPALFAGAPILISLRTASARPAGRVVVTGRTPAGQLVSHRIEVASTAPNDAAAAIWARAHIRDLEDAYVTADTAKQKRVVEQRIVATSLRHRVLSRFTAFLAVDRSEVANAEGNPRPITQAVESPSGWEMGLAAAAPNRERRALGSAGSVPPGSMPVAMARMPAAPAPMAAPPPSGLPPVGAPPAPAPKRSMGLMERARNLLSWKPPAEFEDAPASLDVRPYLARIRDVAKELERSASQSDAQAFDLTVARLQELLEDLLSIGEFSDLAASLEPVLAKLRALLGKELGHATELAEELRAIADGRRPSAESAPRRPTREFWK